MKSSIHSLILAAEFSIIIAILSQLSFPIGIIPLTGQTFAIGLAATLLGKKIGTISILIYLLLGLIGLPVFAGMTAGFGVLFGVTGGYLIGFILNGWLTGMILEKTTFNYQYGIIANLIGSMVPMITGTLWLKLFSNSSWETAWMTGFLPFIIPWIIKAIASAYLGIFLRKRLSAYFFKIPN
ncbi:ECF transporter substrate-specific protein BioY [Melissococcus plutonius DAT561]|uniref:Biotin transporter n=1 Tax=Melissococcus plutonius TaxID=33970 RepID=A0A2Z5Y410_9ENTE|nr:biotin transporter BioY [Melissococcus plutonius]BAL62771.1 ECF transporter substrate-specific protein BioY [Melissococcus plutonius DAT561]BBC61652.1 substrate-specific component BioY of biotin ECF transporter [Melissococcus plutonius]